MTATAILREIVEMLKVKEETVCKWIRKGKLAAIRMEKGYRITDEAIRAFVRDRA